jgi:thiol-disulfide isomerase/thioredoxin
VFADRASAACASKGVPHLRRNYFVFLALLAALTIIVWAGIYNFLKHRQDRQRQQATQAVLVQEPPSQGPDTAQAAALQGKPAPDFTLEDTTGKKISLASYKGKAVVVNFWATWCAPCKVETPWLIALHEQYAPKGLEILGVSADLLDDDDKPRLAQEKADIVKFATNAHMNYPVLLNGDSISQHYGGVDALPTSFFIDRKGTVVASTIGLVPRDEVEADMKKALAGGGE